MTQNDRPGGFQGMEPDVARMIQGGARNRATQTAKQQREARRIRVRADVPQPLKDLLDHAAQEYATSTSQMGAALWAYALLHYYGEDEELHNLLGAMCVDARTPHHDFALDLYAEIQGDPPVLARLTVLAEAYFRAEQTDERGQ